jgi:hypothetical protein
VDEQQPSDPLRPRWAQEVLNDVLRASAALRAINQPPYGVFEARMLLPISKGAASMNSLPHQLTSASAASNALGTAKRIFTPSSAVVAEMPTDEAEWTLIRDLWEMFSNSPR